LLVQSHETVSAFFKESRKKIVIATERYSILVLARQSVKPMILKAPVMYSVRGIDMRDDPMAGRPLGRQSHETVSAFFFEPFGKKKYLIFNWD